jgi:hypothetical protein
MKEVVVGLKPLSIHYQVKSRGMAEASTVVPTH